MIHIVSALNIPVVAIYESTAINYAKPLCNNYKVSYSDIDCHPCKPYRYCPYGHYNCLMYQTPSIIYNKVIQLYESVNS